MHRCTREDVLTCAIYSSSPHNTGKVNKSTTNYSSSLIRKRNRSRINTNNKFRNITRFILRRTSMARNNNSINIPRRATSGRSITTIPMMSTYNRPATRTIQQMSNCHLSPLHRMVSTTISLRISKRRPCTNTFPRYQDRLYQRKGRPLLITLTISIRRRTLNILLRVNLRISSNRFSTTRTTRHTRRSNRPHILIK